MVLSKGVRSAGAGCAGEVEARQRQERRRRHIPRVSVDKIPVN